MTTDIGLGRGIFVRNNTETGGLQSGCCCERECIMLANGFVNGLDDPSFNIEGSRIVEMCIHATVKENWEYIWNPRRLYDAFRYKEGEGLTDPDIVYNGCWDFDRIPLPELIPENDIIPAPIPSGISFSMSSKYADSISPPYPAFPLSAYDQEEMDTLPAFFNPCWDLRNYNNTGYIEQRDVSYFGGTVGVELCDGDEDEKEKRKLGIGISWEVGKLIAGSWEEDEEITGFGKIIRDGPYKGWFERPKYMRTMIYSVHERAYLSGYKDGGDPPIPREQPEWPDGWYSNASFNCPGTCAPPVFYISEAQRITWEVMIRLESEITE